MIRSFLKDQRAASAVEFALVSPFLLMMVAAVISYGSIFATSLSLQQLVAETARATIGGLNDSERKTLAQAHLNATSSSYPILRADHVSFEFSGSDGSNVSRITMKYDMTDHPAYIFDKLLPLPPSPISYSMIVTDGGGVGS